MSTARRYYCGITVDCFMEKKIECIEPTENAKEFYSAKPFDEGVSDEDLVKKCLDGDEAATEAIFNRYKVKVTEIARSYYLLSGEIEDLVQEGMLGLFRAVKTYGGAVPFKNYALKCVKNGIISAVRAASGNKHKPLNSASSEMLEDFGDDSLDPEKMFFERETESNIDLRFKEILSEKEYSVYKLYLKGFSLKDMANSLNVKEKSVDNAVQRIKKKAKEVKWDI